MIYKVSIQYHDINCMISGSNRFVMQVYMAFVWLIGFVLIANMVPLYVSITLVAMLQTLFFN